MAEHRFEYRLLNHVQIIGLVTSFTDALRESARPGDMSTCDRLLEELTAHIDYLRGCRNRLVDQYEERIGEFLHQDDMWEHRSIPKGTKS